MIEKLFAIALISFVAMGVYYQDKNYHDDLREYYYCTPYHQDEDPPIPPLAKFELNNFEKNYPNFNTKYNCEAKLYTRNQFYIMRKARK
jgi:hypothetical protein